MKIKRLYMIVLPDQDTVRFMDTEEEYEDQAIIKVAEVYPRYSRIINLTESTKKVEEACLPN